MRLNPEQLKAFDEQGYLFLPECFSDEEVAALRRDAEAIYRSDRPEVWKEKSGAPRTAFAAHLYNEGFRLLGAHPGTGPELHEVDTGPDRTSPVVGSVPCERIIL